MKTRKSLRLPDDVGGSAWEEGLRRAEQSGLIRPPAVSIYEAHVFDRRPRYMREWRPYFTPSEWMVLDVVAERTWGWGKESDHISLTQFQSATGLARTTVIRALAGLIAKCALLPLSRGRRGVWRWQITRPEPHVRGSPDQCQNDTSEKTTGSEMIPVDGRTGSESAPTREKEKERKDLKEKKQGRNRDGRRFISGKDARFIDH